MLLKAAAGQILQFGIPEAAEELLEVALPATMITL